MGSSGARTKKIPIAAIARRNLMLKIILPHRAKSVPVPDWNTIRELAEELRELANGKFQGQHTGAVALHYSQVCDKDPWNFFVLSREGEQLTEFKSWCIVNPVIFSLDTRTKFQAREGCMSFPFRNNAKVRRYSEIVATYDYKPLLGGDNALINRSTLLTGFTAQVFQHESDHAKGKSIFD